MAKLVRLTESDICRIVENSVNSVLNEIGDSHKGQDWLGQAAGRREGQAELEYRKNGNSERHKKLSSIRQQLDKKSKDEIAKSSSKHKSDLRHSFNDGVYKGRGKGLGIK